LLVTEYLYYKEGLQVQINKIPAPHSWCAGELHTSASFSRLSNQSYVFVTLVSF